MMQTPHGHHTERARYLAEITRLHRANDELRRRAYLSELGRIESLKRVDLLMHNHKKLLHQYRELLKAYEAEAE